MNTLVFDIGGTNLRIGIARGRTLEPFKVCPVPKEYTHALRMIRRIAGELSQGRKIDVVTGGVPGIFNKQKTKLIQSTHLGRWVGKSLAVDLAKIFLTKVLLRNDCECIGLGEALYGAGRGYPIIAYIGFGTGIGGSRIVNGKVDSTAFGYAPGHHIVDFDARNIRSITPHHGDWESFVSGMALRLRFGKPAEQLRQKHVWKEMEQYAALGLVNITTLWSPDVIVLGGSLMKSMSLGNIQILFKKSMRVFPILPTLKRATLGDAAGLYGAMELAHKL